MQNGPCCANSMTTPPAMLHHVYRAHNGLHHRAAASAATATLWRALWCVPGAGGTLQRAGVPACSAWPHSTPPVTWQRGSPHTGSRRHHRPTGAARRRVVLLHLCIRRAYVVAGRVRYLHFAAIRGICKIDLCSPVQTLARCGRCGCTFRKEF